MNQFFFRFFLIVSAFVFQCSFSQNYPDGLSDGTLTINSKSIPVKIFSTTSGNDLQNFADKDPKQNVLVILNSDLNEYALSVYNQFLFSGYQLLDKDFQPVQFTPDNSTKYKYLYRPAKTSDEMAQGNVVKLNTEFKIWDPSKGFKIGNFTLHYYSLMFVLAFGLGYFLMTKIFKIDNVNEKYLEPLFIWTLIGTILGARLGHVIFYQPELFKEDFWSVFLPIQTKPTFKFTGFSGLASHGATIALILTTLYYSIKIIKKNPLWVYDRLAIVIALGGTFVRMGNFFNSEIIGKTAPESSPFAVLFPQMSNEYGATVPRYPSQLFEATGYLVLFVILWLIYRYTKKKYQQGWIFGLFFVLLWSIRFFVEFLKEPQGDEFIHLGSLNTGQVLSIPFIIAGIVLMFLSKKFTITQAENAKPE